MSYFITGTDTDVGKTIACSWLMLQSPKAQYWKPIQAGLEEQDLQRVQALTKLPSERFNPCSYVLKEPLSPHESARREGRTISLTKINLPQKDGSMIIEGAGGILVPLNAEFLMVDLMKQLNLPIILVARTGLGTINHTLLSLEVLRARGLKIEGVILNGDIIPHNREAIKTYGRVKIIAEIPRFKALSKELLRKIKPQEPLTL